MGLLDIRPYINATTPQGVVRIDSPELWDWLSANRGAVYFTPLDPETRTGQTRLEGDGESVPVVHHITHGELWGGNPVDYGNPLDISGAKWLWAGGQKFDRYASQELPIAGHRLVTIYPDGTLVLTRKVIGDSEFWRSYLKGAIGTIAAGAAVYYAAGYATAGQAATAGAGATAGETATVAATTTGGTTVATAGTAASTSGFSWQSVAGAAQQASNAVRAVGAAAATISTALTQSPDTNQPSAAAQGSGGSQSTDPKTLLALAAVVMAAII